jgi:hypothetical protein
MTDAPAHITNERLDILATNQLNAALYSELFGGREPPVSAPRFVFLDSRAREFYLDWDRAARDVVAVLRSAAGRNPYDRELSDLIGELSTRSDEFRIYWASHDVQFFVSGVKAFHHPAVGDITLNYERLEITADSGLTITTYPQSPAPDPSKLIAGAVGGRSASFVRLRQSSQRDERPLVRPAHTACRTVRQTARRVVRTEVRRGRSGVRLPQSDRGLIVRSAGASRRRGRRVRAPVEC